MRSGYGEVASPIALGLALALAVGVTLALILSRATGSAAVPSLPQLMGDVTQDGRVDILDVVRTRNHFAGDDGLAARALPFADSNQDDLVDERDLQPLVDAILGKGEPMPVSGGTLRSLRFDDFDGGIDLGPTADPASIWIPACTGGEVRGTGGRLVIELTGPEQCAGAELLGRFEGDFDVVADFHLLDVPDDNDLKIVLSADGHCIDGSCAGTVERTVGFGGFGTHHYATNFEGSVACFGDAGDCFQLDDRSGVLRLIRRGSEWTAFAGTELGTLVPIRTGPLHDRPVQFRLFAFTTAAGSAGTVAFDNFRASRPPRGDGFGDGVIDPGQWTEINPPQVEEIGGELVVSLPPDLPDGATAAGVRTVGLFAGDFDARVHVRQLAVPVPNDLKISLQIAGASASVQLTTGFSAPAARDWLAFLDARPIVHVTTLETSGWLRLVRRGQSVAAFYREAGPEWVELDVATLPELPDAVHLELVAFLNTASMRNAQGVVSFDDFAALPVEMPENPATDGRWQEPAIDTEVLAVHAAVMPTTGEVLYLSGSGNDPDRHAARQFESRLFDPESGSLQRLTTGGDVFCAGHAFLPDGRLLIPGGTEVYGTNDFDFLGLRGTYLFDPTAPVAAFQPADPMADGRWYPTAIAIPDGRVMVVSGNVEAEPPAPAPLVNLTVELYDPATGLWDLPTALPPDFEPALYPRLHLVPGGKVVHTSPGEKTLVVDPSAEGRPWVQLTDGAGVPLRTLYGFRDFGNSVLLPLEPPEYRARILVVGGTNYASDPAFGGHTLATATAEILELEEVEGALQGSWRYVQPMRDPRVDAMSVLLPDGTVLTLGGAVAKEIRTAGVLAAEIFDPASESWRQVARSRIPRVYHSVAVLLPDGRVWVAGSNPQQKIEEGRMEVYLPPYLFDASGELRPDGDRPMVVGVPEVVGYGESFLVEVLTHGEAVSRVVLMRPNAATHASDMSQRQVALCLACGAPGAGGTLSLAAPPSPDLAPPGYYLLFVVDGRGVPSKAEWIRLSG